MQNEEIISQLRIAEVVAEAQGFLNTAAALRDLLDQFAISIGVEDQTMDDRGLELAQPGIVFLQ